MGLAPLEYYSLTQVQFIRKMTGFTRHSQKQYDHTRLVCWMIAAVNRDPKRPMPNPDRWWPLPIDGNLQLQDNSEDRVARLKRRVEEAQKYLEQRKNGE